MYKCVQQENIKNKSRQKKGGRGKDNKKKRGSEKKQKTQHANLITHNTFYFHTQHNTTHTFTHSHSQHPPPNLLLFPKPLTHNNKQMRTQNTQTFVLAYSFVLTQVVLKTIDNQQTKHIVLSIVCFTPCLQLFTSAYSFLQVPTSAYTYL